MLRLISRSVLVLMTWLLCQGAPCDAAPIVPGLTTFYGRAIQDVRVLGGTPINPGSEFVIDDLFGDGYIIIDRQAQVGNSISFTGVDSVFSGFRPELGFYTFGAAGSVGVGSFHGTIDNIIQDPSDPGFAAGNPSSLISGDITFDVPSFYFQLAGGAVTLETGAEFTFTAMLDGIPPRTATLLEGRIPVDEIPVYLGTQLVGYSSDRRIELRAVPEPSSMVLLGIGGLALVGYQLRRRKVNVKSIRDR